MQKVVGSSPISRFGSPLVERVFSLSQLAGTSASQQTVCKPFAEIRRHVPRNRRFAGKYAAAELLTFCVRAGTETEGLANASARALDSCRGRAEDLRVSSTRLAR